MDIIDGIAAIACVFAFQSGRQIGSLGETSRKLDAAPEPVMETRKKTLLVNRSGVIEEIEIEYEVERRF